MYRNSLNTRDRAVTITAVLLVHGALALALLNLSGHLDFTERQPNLQIIDVNADPPPPPVVEIERPKPKPKDEEGAASAPNIKSHATPVVRPKPEVVVPTVPAIVAAPTPNSGAEATQGAAPVVGPGTGAGGTGNGTGSGGSGNGNGGGGGGQAIGASIVRDIRGSEYPNAIRARWPRGGQIFTRLRISPEGRVIQCDVPRSFGDALADQWTCALLRERAVFRPARDADGNPIAAWFGYIQSDRK